MKAFRYSSEVLLDAPLADVFEFFSCAENLEKLSPASIRFKILTPLPIFMKTGVLIDYRLRIRGIPMGWRTEISVWEPGVRFVDRQLSGPYAKWVHEHKFKAEGHQTRMWDTVDYALPFGPVGLLAHALFVRKEIEGIFRYRAEAIDKWLASRKPLQPLSRPL